MSNCYICEEEAEIDEAYSDKHLVSCELCKSYFLTIDAIMDAKKYQINIEKFRQYVDANSQIHGDYPVIDSYTLETFYA